MKDWWVNLRIKALGRAQTKTPRWTMEDLLRLNEFILRGWSDQRIAKALGRSVTAVRLKRRRAGIISRTRTLLSARGAADLLGLHCAKTVGHWIDRGWLKAHRGQRRGGNRQWVITTEALYDFTVNPARQHLFDLGRIRDPFLNGAGY